LLAGLPSTDSAASAGVASDSTADSLTRGEPRADVETLIKRADLLSARFAAVSDSLEVNAKRFASVPSIMPTPGWLTSQFSKSRDHPLLHISRPHEGIDVATPMGTPIEAPAAGVVAFSGRETGYGNVIVIDHGFGIRTKYAHCSKLIVGAGAKVTRGQQIALVGNTGLSTGPHLHYEVLVNGQPVDPLRYILSDRAIVD
jgi:murein DD-endopeptidase MepM/ murein hydrolase activator NlpD